MPKAKAAAVKAAVNPGVKPVVIRCEYCSLYFPSYTALKPGDPVHGHAVVPPAVDGLFLGMKCFGKKVIDINDPANAQREVEDDYYSIHDALRGYPADDYRVRAWIGLARLIKVARKAVKDKAVIDKRRAK
jgi:hypothetical protein